MEAIGFPDILSKEGSVLGLPIARSCDGRHCFALVTEAQRKDRRSRKRSEKWERENLLWIAIPDDNKELRHTVCRAHLESGPFIAVYQEGFPLPVLESFEAIPKEAPAAQPALGL